MEWLKSTWDSIYKAAKNDYVLLIPTGSIEQHGLHLPLGTDVMISQEICKRISLKIKRSVVSFPIFLSFVEKRFSKPGTISISKETVKKMFTNLIKDFIDIGFRKILIVNGHEENKDFLPEICRKFSVNGTKIISFEWWGIAWEKISQVLGSSKNELGPGCEDETSLFLYFKPELVKKDKIEDFLPDDKVSIEENPSKTGVIGKPSLATREKGEKIMEAVVDEFCKVIKKEFKIIK